LRDWLSVPTDRPALLKAQYRAFSTQIPLLYVVLLINTWLLVSTHAGTAPRSLTLWFPLGLSLVCAVRLISWWRSRSAAPDADRAWRHLNRTNRLAALLSTGFVTWGLLLFPHGNPLQQSHVAFFIAITMIGCIVCLLHVRQAMLTVALIGNLGFIGIFASTGVPTFVATAANMALVTLALMFMLLGHYRDFTRLVEAQVQAEQLGAENLRMANLDSLTQLPNRRGFFAHLERCCARARRNGGRFAVGILDLDGFKPVNDLYGHATGDHLLEQVGRRLQMLAGEGVFLARLGGDEFALVIEHLADDELLAFGRRVCAALRKPFHLGDSTLQVAASMGLVTYPDLATNAIDLYEHADYALYHGKRNHRGGAGLFSARHRERIQQDAVIEQTLRQADLERELSVVFQPIVDAGGRHTLAFEALARWHSPSLGEVSPARFIPVAERSGLVSLQTHVLLKKALAAAVHWPAPVRLSFNLSAHDLGAPEMVGRLIDLIAASGFAPARLDLEITETAIMHDLEQVRWAVGEFRRLGCGMTLDDFGTGFSSLSQLHALPLTKIKIDRRFVSGIQDNPASCKIVKSLLALSRDMDLDCIIEGVETADELAVVRALGGAMVQGYFYARPMPVTDTGGWLATAPARGAGADGAARRGRGEPVAAG
jgi:diguanylate cyclase (GGDEF)-like protein